MKFTKKDLIFSVITGLYTGIIAWRVLIFLEKPAIFGIPFSILPLVVPILWILGVNFGYFLGRWMPFFNQFGRFAAIGFTNFIVYTGVLNLLIFYSGINNGTWYSVFVGVAFIIGATHSYGWNKFWVFESGTSRGGTDQFVKFFAVNGVGGLVNVGVASFLVNVIHPQFGISSDGWANIGGIAGSAVALMLTFVGFRLLVFKKQDNALSQISSSNLQ